ncbi:sugar transporter SWEET1-like [Planococcus citri]|uniref:sugar transporter SWEET1-like n=1 Tax=Planococcus citri TaxID=170843 RepID=UPI0031F808D5
MVLEKYSDILSFIASSATIPLLLSPILLCREFVKKGSSDHIKPIVFVGGLTRSILFLQFGITTNLRPLIIIHSLGAVLYTIYLILYYNYCQNKSNVQSLFTKATAFVSVLLGFVNFRTESLIAKYFGAIVTAIHLFLIAVPLLNLKTIIRTKSTHGMPFPIILCGNIVTTSWLLYGISVGNSTIIFQMVIGAVLTGIQLSLFAIYPSTPPSEKKKAN